MHLVFLMTLTCALKKSCAVSTNCFKKLTYCSADITDLRNVTRQLRATVIPYNKKIIVFVVSDVDCIPLQYLEC